MGEYHGHDHSRELLCSFDSLHSRLDRIEHSLTHVMEQGRLMAQLTQDMRNLIAKVDAATTAQAVLVATQTEELTRISAKFTELLDRVANGITPADGAALKAEFEQEVADQEAVTATLTATTETLKGIGADPNNPIP